MFIAQVVGKSMEPTIPDGWWFVFRAPFSGARQKRIVLAELRDEVDPDTGSRFTVKRFRDREGPGRGRLRVRAVADPLEARQPRL